MNYHPPGGQTPTSAKLRRRDAATYIRERINVGSSSLLAKLAVFGGGPRYFKFGERVVLYDPADLDAWIAEKLGKAVTSTSQD